MILVHILVQENIWQLERRMRSQILRVKLRATGIFDIFFLFLCVGIVLDKSKTPSPSLEAVLEPELIEAITKLLDDRNSQVKVAASITLYSLKRPSDKVNSTCP